MKLAVKLLSVAVGILLISTIVLSFSYVDVSTRYGEVENYYLNSYEEFQTAYSSCFLPESNPSTFEFFLDRLSPDGQWFRATPDGSYGFYFKVESLSKLTR